MAFLVDAPEFISFLFCLMEARLFYLSIILFVVYSVHECVVGVGAVHIGDILPKFEQR